MPPKTKEKRTRLHAADLRGISRLVVDATRRVTDVVDEFRSYHANVDVHDPWVSAEDARREYDLELVTELVPGTYDAVILAVAHRQFMELGGERIRALGKPGCVVFDVKQALPRELVDDRL